MLREISAVCVLTGLAGCSRHSDSPSPPPASAPPSAAVLAAAPLDLRALPKGPREAVGLPRDGSGLNRLCVICRGTSWLPPDLLVSCSRHNSPAAFAKTSASLAGGEWPYPTLKRERTQATDARRCMAPIAPDPKKISADDREVSLVGVTQAACLARLISIVVSADGPVFVFHKGTAVAKFE